MSQDEIKIVKFKQELPHNDFSCWKDLIFSQSQHEYPPKILTAHNWQKWKRVFLTCPCHKFYRDEAVGLKSCNYTWKITIFVKMSNLGQYHENLIFCQ